MRSNGAEEGTPARSHALAAGPALAQPGEWTMAKLPLASPAPSALARNMELTPPLYLLPGVFTATKPQGVCKKHILKQKTHQHRGGSPLA